MKKITLVLLSILIMFSTSLYAVTKKIISYSIPAGRENMVEKGNTLTNNQIAAIINRVNEINGMDKSKMTSGQKLQLKSELKNDIIVVRHQHARYIYISLGAAIIIILLLILIL